MDEPVVAKRPTWMWIGVAIVLLLAVVWLLARGGGGGAGGTSLAICPVAEGLVKDNFGAPRNGHGHYGNDILAAYAEPVLAPFSGTTSTSGTPGGLIVTLRAPDGATMVGKHLSSVTDPGEVRTGDVLGSVGKLAVEESNPHLHFEWHPNGDDVVVDPFPLLREVCPNTREA